MIRDLGLQDLGVCTGSKVAEPTGSKFRVEGLRPIAQACLRGFGAHGIDPKPDGLAGFGF